MVKTDLHCLLSLLLTLAAGPAAALCSGRPWPLPGPIVLSSTFGEYREGHIHAGLDLRTFGREGVPCRAVDRGSVVRLRASAQGYGKAAYLKLSTGETVVYAHLSEFSLELEDFLYREQEKRGSYEVDLYPPPGRFVVERGQVIGYSGSTAASAPHLHFEVRDSLGRPVNALSRGWRVRDSFAPVLRGLEWMPLGPEARIDGDCFPQEVGLEMASAGYFFSPDTVSLLGPVGLAVWAVDTSSPSSGSLAPYQLELVVDGIELASITEESFSYEQSSEVCLEYEMKAVRESDRHYLVLFSRRGETLPHREFRHRGQISSRLFPGREDEVHVALVRCFDREGNVSIAKAPFRFSSGPESERGGERGTYIWSDLLSLPRGVRPPWIPTSDGDPLTLTCREVGGRVLELDSALVVPLLHGSARSLPLVPLRLSLAQPKGSLFGDTFVELALAGEEVGSRQGELVPAGFPFRLGPSSLALRRPLQLSLQLSLTAGGCVRLYRWDGKKGEWSYCGGRVREDSLRVQVSEPGLYRAMVDRTGPRIGAPQLRPHRMWATSAVVPEIVIPVEDRGAGLDFRRSSVYVNGKKRISRWDSFAKKLFVLLRGENIMNRYQVEVEAWDLCGNLTRSRKELIAAPEDH